MLHSNQYEHTFSADGETEIDPESSNDSASYYSVSLKYLLTREYPVVIKCSRVRNENWM